MASLDLARAELAAGAYAQAQARAEGVLRASPPPRIRADALIVAGDGAYGLASYASAAEHYREVLQSDELPPEAARVALALGLTEVRLGRSDDARVAFLRVARQFPEDPRAPVGLVLAAELMAKAGDTMLARKFLDRVLERYPTSPDADVARLSRSVLAMREGRPQEAVSDLRVLVRSGRPSVPAERARLLRGLRGAGALAQPEGHLSSGGSNGAGGDHDGPASVTTAPLGRFAAPFLDGAGDADTTPRVLHGLVLMGSEERAWPEVQALTQHLATRFSSYPATPDLLLLVAGRAASGREWPVVRASYEHLTALPRRAALATKARVDFGEALLRTGAPAPARAELARALEGEPGQETPRALFLLAEANRALDRPDDALAAYDRLRQSYPRTEWPAESRLAYARLLQDAPGQQKRTRAVLEEIVERARGDEQTEASFRLGEVLAADGDHRRAVDWFMAAAYGPEQRSRWYRPALLGAGRSLVALKRTPAALAVYHSMLPPMPAGLAEGVEEPQLVGEAAYRIAEIAREARRTSEAGDMYLTAVRLAPEAPWRGRALVEAIRALVAIGDRPAAEAVSRLLVEDGPGDLEVLTRASQALQSRGRATSKGGR